jgi:glycosyltransferase involved in cell wall biosynthesis
MFERGAWRRIEEMAPGPDLVQVNGLPDFARRLETRMGIPVVLLFHGPPSERHAAAIRASRTVVGVGAVAPYLVENFRQDIHLMTGGVDADLFRPGAPPIRTRLGLPEGAPVILFAGRLVPLKNLPLLVESFASIRAKLPGVRLLVAGDGPLRGEFMSSAGRAGLGVSHVSRADLLSGRTIDQGTGDDSVSNGTGTEDRPGRSTRDASDGGPHIIHVSDIQHEEMPRCYASADLLLLTSVNESFSLVALEAMACGIPVVAPAVGNLPHLVENGVGGVLYPPGDKEACVSAVLHILNDAAERRRLGAGGREIASRRHSWDAVAGEFLALYRKILAS